MRANSNATAAPDPLFEAGLDGEHQLAG
jgi:hypothetical protein